MGIFSGNRNKETNSQKQESVNQVPLTDAQKLLQEFKGLDSMRSSREFKQIKNTLERMAAETNLEKKEKLNEKFGKRCREYLQSKEGAESQRTKDKMDLVERALGYQHFTACEIVHDQIKAMDYEPINLDSAKKITGYSKKFQDAYEAFRNYPNKKGVNIDSRNQMQQKYDTHLEINVDAVRSLPKLEEAIRQNRPWGQVSFPVPIVEAMNDAQKVGAGLSSRSVVMVDGKKGVFSEYSETTMDKVLQNAISALPPGEIQSALGNHFEDILEFCNRNSVKTMSVADGKEGMMMASKQMFYMFVKEKLDEGNLEEQKEKYKDLMDAMEKEEFDETLLFMTEQAKGFGVIERNFEERKIALEKGNLDKRNELTSRMADALGLGHMVAHSERVKMVRSGKIIEGNFMEFAEGFDANTEDPQKTEVWHNLALDDPGFQRDINRIEVFDFLCGQNDRHPGNMIYTLGKPGADGKCRITGFKGIDNDGSFQPMDTKMIINDVYNKDIKKITGVDKELAEKIEKLSREDLEFYLGDVLDKESMDKTEERLKAMQEHFKTCKMIEKEDWEQKSPAVKELDEAEAGPLHAIKEDQDKSRRNMKTQEKIEEENLKKKEGAVYWMNDAIGKYREKAGRTEPVKETKIEKEDRERVLTNVKTLEKQAYAEICTTKAYFHNRRVEPLPRTREVQAPGKAMGK